MNSVTEMGMNRTGMATSPVDGKALVEGAREGEPTSVGDELLLDALRDDYVTAKAKVGSVPPPASMKGALGAVVNAVKGADLASFIDRLGERLAFERTGTRLYEALIGKYQHLADTEMEPTLGQLRQIHDEEMAHFALLRAAIGELGGDPTVETPAADVAGVASMGLPKVLTDPRTTFTQCLEAVLIAELVDNDGWALLIKMAEQFGHEDIAARFRDALAEEQKHLALVRSWLKARVLKGRPVD